MDALEIYWFIFFVSAALWCGGKADDDDMAWMFTSLGAGILAVVTAHSFVASVFNWLESVIPSAGSVLHPITAGVLTLLICLAFILFLNLAGAKIKIFDKNMASSRPS